MGESTRGCTIEGFYCSLAREVCGGKWQYFWGKLSLDPGLFEIYYDRSGLLRVIYVHMHRDAEMREETYTRILNSVMLLGSGCYYIGGLSELLLSWLLLYTVMARAREEETVH